MNTAIIIPARYASTRLPGKPLLRETGKYLIEHAYERASQARCAQQVIVATDDPRIVSAVHSFGGQAMMTSRFHPSGTDRVAEVARRLNADIVVNLQGDEPLIDPAHIDEVVGLLLHHRHADVATLATPLRELEQLHNPNCVKVVIGDCGQALYFSRAPVPYVRDGTPDLARQPYQFFQHLGLYAYRQPFLLRLTGLVPSPLEKLEKLEQLRVLAMGRTIQVGIVSAANAGVDTRADYDAFVSEYRRRMRPAA